MGGENVYALRGIDLDVYKGEFIYKGNKITTPLLISEKKWQRVQDNLKANNNNSSRNNKKNFFLF